MLVYTWYLGYSLPKVALNPTYSFGSPRGDSPIRTLSSTMFRLMFHRAFGSHPLTTFFPVSFESQKGTLAPKCHCVTTISFHILLP